MTGPNPYGLGSAHQAGSDWDDDAAFWRDGFVSKADSRDKNAPRITTTPGHDAMQRALDRFVKEMSSATIEAKIGCTDCGQDHVRQGKRTCNAHSRRATPLRPCRNFPPHGLAVCRFHGGAAPQVASKAERRIIEGQLLAAVDAHAASQPGPVLLPEPKGKKGGRDPNSRLSQRARRRRAAYRRDEP